MSWASAREGVSLDPNSKKATRLKLILSLGTDDGSGLEIAALESQKKWLRVWVSAEAALLLRGWKVEGIDSHGYEVLVFLHSQSNGESRCNPLPNLQQLHQIAHFAALGSIKP
jgi:hypothetical protein